jgi:Leucine-rich repeat (LRR) protein
MIDMNLENPHTKMRVLMITLLCFLAFSMAVKGQISQEEKNALLEFHKQTNGLDWINTWNLNEDPSTWYGLRIVDNKVTEINLFRNNLSGTLPESIGDLKHLNHLNLAFNSISGMMPHTIVKLKYVKVFKVEMNRIKGELPEAIGRMHSLEEFTAFNNFLSGVIPESFGTLKNLKILNLSSNNLKGTIPKSLGNLDNLESLGLFENSLEGVIPNTMGNLTNLKELVLANNQLGGAIPAEIGQLASLEILQIQNNKFDSFKNLEQLNTKGLLAFDYDEDSIKNDFKNLKTGGPTRMADTKFEDDDNDDNK